MRPGEECDMDLIGSRFILPNTFAYLFSLSVIVFILSGCTNGTATLTPTIGGRVDSSALVPSSNEPSQNEANPPVAEPTVTPAETPLLLQVEALKPQSEFHEMIYTPDLIDEASGFCKLPENELKIGVFVNPPRLVNSDEYHDYFYFTCVKGRLLTSLTTDSIDPNPVNAMQTINILATRVSEIAGQADALFAILQTSSEAFAKKYSSHPGLFFVVENKILGSMTQLTVGCKYCQDIFQLQIAGGLRVIDTPVVNFALVDEEKNSKSFNLQLIQSK